MNKALIWTLSLIVILLIGILGFEGYLLGTGFFQKPTPAPTATSTHKTARSATASPTVTTVTPMSPTATPTPKFGTFKGYVTPVEGLRLRQGPSLEAVIITVMPFSSEITIDGETDGWYHCIYESQTGYCSKDYVSKENPTANWVTYTNSTYGFSLKLPWSNYTTDTNTYTGITEDVRFWISTTDSSWPEYPKYNIFVITVCTKAQWDVIKNSEGPKPFYLGENASWVFAFSQAQAAPADATDKINLIPQIRTTFKLISSL